MLGPIHSRAHLLLLLGTRLCGLASASAIDDTQEQRVLAPISSAFLPSPHHDVDPAILAALNAHADPVDALIALQPELADELARPRLLHVAGTPEAQWQTEGDKLRLRRKGKKFTDLTDHEEFYSQQTQSEVLTAGKARKVPQSFATRSEDDAIDFLTSSGIL